VSLEQRLEHTCTTESTTEGLGAKLPDTSPEARNNRSIEDLDKGVCMGMERGGYLFMPEDLEKGVACPHPPNRRRGADGGRVRSVLCSPGGRSRSAGGRTARTE
jgi:hypothetical protein